ncbi:MAG: hypothetical protein ACI9XO_003732, partial [Paraglaciecola sp.]
MRDKVKILQRLHPIFNFFEKRLYSIVSVKNLMQNLYL